MSDKPTPLYIVCDSILSVMNHIESDLISDRTRIDKLIEGQENILTSMKNIYDRLPRLEDKTNDAVAATVQPVIDSVDKLTKEMKKVGDK